MSKKSHYTYLLVDKNHKKYGGVRTYNGLPEDDGYMGSSKYVDEAMKSGMTFNKHIVRIFDTRDEANDYESGWLNRVRAAQSDGWYNQTNTYPNFHTEGMKLGPQSEEHKRKLSGEKSHVQSSCWT